MDAGFGFPVNKINLEPNFLYYLYCRCSLLMKHLKDEVQIYKNEPNLNRRRIFTELMQILK